MKFSQLFRFATRFLFRNWSSGGLGTIFLLIVTVITLLSSMSWYSDRMQSGINAHSAELFGGDLIVKSSQALPESWMKQAQRMDLKFAEVIYINSMIANKKEKTNFANVQIKAVASNYPLYGTIRVSSLADPNKTEDTSSSPEPGTVWLESRAAQELHVSPQDTVEIGNAKLVFTRYLYETPDGQTDQFKIAPSLLMSLGDLPKTQILGERSRADYLLLLAGNVKPYLAWIKPSLKDGQKATLALDGRTELKAGFNQTTKYLKLGIFLIILLAGSVINVGLKEYNSRNDISVGILRCLGLYKHHITIILIIQFVELILLAGLIALPLGYAVHHLWHLFLGEILPDALPNQLTSINWFIGVEALLFCSLFLFAFSIQHWLGLSQISPLMVLRKEEVKKTKSFWFFFIIKNVIIFTLLYLYLRDLQIIIGGLVVLLVMVLVMRGICSLISLLLRKVAPYLPTILNITALNITRYMPHRYIQIMAFTLISFAASFSYFLYDSLIHNWQRQILPDSANYFIFNISPEEVGPLRKFIALNNVPVTTEYPIIRGRLTDLDGVPLKKNGMGDQVHNNALNRELNITATNELPKDNQLVAGTWWDKNYSGAPLASVEEGLANHFGIKIGDKLAFRVADQDLTVTVSSIRKVLWANQQPNFYVIVTPQLLDQCSITYLFGIRLPPAQESFLNQLRQNFPSLTTVSIAMLVEQASIFFKQLSLLIAWIFLFILFVGIISQSLVLWATRKERELETAMLKILGMTNTRLVTMWVTEYGFYALVSSVTGIFLAYLLQKFLLEYFLNIQPVVNLWSIVIIIVLNELVILLSTIINIKKSMEITPISLIK